MKLDSGDINLLDVGLRCEHERLGAQVITFLRKYHAFCSKSGGHNLAKKSKKAKAASREQHRQSKRAKKMERKQKKKLELPAKHRKGKK